MTIIEIRSAGLTAQLAPQAGGRLARLQWRRPSKDTVDIVVPLTTPLEGQRWPKAGAYPLIPYANRIAEGRLHFLGEEFAIAAHPDAYPHSLHGHTQLEQWTASGSDHHAELALTCGPTAAWPWAIETRQRYEVENDRLRITMSVRNRNSGPMPAGLGWHPYFISAGDEKISYEAPDWWPHQEDYLPTGRVQPPGAALLSPIMLRDQEITAYLGAWSGDLSILRGDGIRISLSADKIFEHLVIHHPKDANYLCAEPVTHVANGFNLAAAGIGKTGMHVLAPGEELSGRLSLTLSEDQT